VAVGSCGTGGREDEVRGTANRIQVMQRSGSLRRGGFGGDDFDFTAVVDKK
jgi:hypothetical protein